MKCVAREAVILTTMLVGLVGCKSVPKSDAPQTASMADQRMCAEQAAKFIENNEASGSAAYTNHYDLTSKTCYIEVNHSNFQNEVFSQTKTIYDAFEKREYGDLFFTKSQDHGLNMAACHIRPRGQSEIVCKSEQEFDTLALKYFGTTAD